MGTKVKLLRPLDGKDVGAIAEYPDADAARLIKRGLVEPATAAKAKAPAAKPAPRRKKGS